MICLKYISDSWLMTIIWQKAFDINHHHTTATEDVVESTFLGRHQILPSTGLTRFSEAFPDSNGFWMTMAHDWTRSKWSWHACFCLYDHNILLDLIIDHNTSWNIKIQSIQSIMIFVGTTGGTIIRLNALELSLPVQTPKLLTLLLHRFGP